MADDNLDAFLDFIDADPEYDSEDEVTVHQSEPSSSKDKSSEKKLTFEDVFGSPIKKKKPNDFSKKSNSSEAKPHSSSSNSSLASEKSKDVNFTKGARPRVAPAGTKPQVNGLNSSQIVVDPISKVRLFKTSITLYVDGSMEVESVLKERNLGVHYTPLMAFKWWYNCGGGKDQKSFFTGGVLVRKSTIRKSANGNDYIIWDINNLSELEKCWTVFLFGATATSSSLSAVGIGSYIDLISPAVMESATDMKFSINNINQIRHIGTARDFGYCQSKRKDGQPCRAIVNTAECNVCIHHASGELKKMHRKSKSANNGFGNPAKSNPRNSKSLSFSSDTKPPAGVVTVNFGNPTVQKPTTTNNSNIPKNIRMSLQDPSNTVKRNQIRQGNPESISFAKEKHKFLEDVPAVAAKRMDLNLDPLRTRHLTEKDRRILEALGGCPESSASDIPAMIATNPNAGGRNFMQYLNRKQCQLENTRAAESANEGKNDIGSITMTRETLNNMQKALSFVKKNGPIKKADPNFVGIKRKFAEMNEKVPPSSSNGQSGSKKKTEKAGEIDLNSAEYEKILNAKSIHFDLLDNLQQGEYFEQLEKKEAIEKKLLSTFSVPTNAVMCRSCKYVALSQSEYCKEQRHQIRVVKASKRFFKCKDCGNRTMSLDRLPKRPCKNCESSNWQIAPLGKERTGPLLPSERLSVRGDEEKFLGSASAKLFL